jgi:dTDP-4-amino-4,6-dideoxygalactose transaminase
MQRRFTGSFTQQAELPEESLSAAMRVLKTARLHRYNTLPDQPSETSLLEREFADWQGSKYALACASGGQAMQIALRAAGIQPDDVVLTNAFTLAPVPGCITAVGARPELIETTEDLVPDFTDLEDRASKTGATFLMLSQMRGHMADMDRVLAICKAHGITMIEDCAHTMGATWDGKNSGNFGLAGCFSTQTYKHLNSGEGGLLTSDDPDFMARAIMLSGSYMLYERHGAAPGPEVFARHKLDTPNMSARLDDLRAAILRPQLAIIEDSISGWNDRYTVIEQRLSALTNIVHMANRDPRESFVGSSIQFRIPGVTHKDADDLLNRLAERGVEVKWFGRPEPLGFTSTHTSWRYLGARRLPQTDEILGALFDMRVPLSFSVSDCDLISEILAEEITATTQSAA